MKEFPRAGFGSKPDYSGYDTNTYAPRTGEEHKVLAAETLKATTKAARENLESSNGVRYSQFFRLPYFDPIKSHVVDPMHNLLLGTAKHTFSVWVETNVLTDSKIDEIDEKIKEMGKHTELGRTTKSMTHCKSMKADEWKNWVFTFSLYSLRDLIPKNHYHLWQIFVRACLLLINTSITRKELDDAHTLLILFCKKFQELYGSEYCTPNMHMHMHLRECVLRFGPTYGFWAFSFERYNGILGAYHTNNRAMTITMMRKFIDGVCIIASYQNIELDDKPSLNQFDLLDVTHSTTLQVDVLRRENVLTEASILMVLHSTLSVPKLGALAEKEIDELETVVKAILPSKALIGISKFVRIYERVMIRREVITSARYRDGSNKDNYVVVRSADGNLNNLCPVSVEKIFSADVSFRQHNSEVQMMFLKAKYFEEHQQRNWYGERSPMKIWSTTTCGCQLVPINFVTRKVSFTKAKQYFDVQLVPGDERSVLRGLDIVNFVL